MPARLLRSLPPTDGAALSDRELIAIALGPCAGAEPLAKLFPTAQLLAQAGVAELARSGLGEARARRLKAALELGRRTLAVPLQRGDSIKSARDVHARLRGHFAGLERAELHVFGLDTRNRLVTHFVPCVGAANLVYVEPRDVFRPLLRESAQAALVVHNHPSGDREPSDADADLTLRLADAGRLVGIALLDHVIVAADDYYSFAESCRLLRSEQAA